MTELRWNLSDEGLCGICTSLHELVGHPNELDSDLEERLIGLLEAIFVECEKRFPACIQVQEVATERASAAT